MVNAHWQGKVASRFTAIILDRELNGLLEAMDVKSGIIVTLNQNDTLQKNGTTIRVDKAHEFF